jgi:hypothetical protein
VLNGALDLLEQAIATRGCSEIIHHASVINILSLIGINFMINTEQKYRLMEKTGRWIMCGLRDLGNQ